MSVTVEAGPKVTGTIFDIKKFAVHDGPGIRTTVFLKGCPLRCLWCHNPESVERGPQVAYRLDKCIGCGSCVRVCPAGCHRMAGELHVFDRQGCVQCGACAQACYMKALERIGREASVDEVLGEVLKDKRYFEKSGGGLTLSGGEPMAQPAFTAALLRAAKRAGLHTCLDTCGQAPFENYRAVLEHVDLFLYDVKETDAAKHREYTGVDNRLILENLVRLDSAGARTILRCPIIPGLNDRASHFAELAKLANRLAGVVEVNLMPYHPYGSSKGDALERVNPLGELAAATREQADAWLAQVQAATRVPVRRG
ncbi:MAG: glycyl-radical enzyme activating protein [Kiritimatiellae bacterium]|nr:glycyl-radical enzyme activating protein [Kiritimatiellia bacterium]